MQEVKELDFLISKINTGNPVLIYFSSENCSVCKVLKPKIENEIKNNFLKIELFEVKADLYKQIASHFTIFSIPSILVFFDKKEFNRQGRNISVPMFIKDIKRVYELFYME
ncbi:thiol reductase thioredoxin [Malaciobacter molluscorum LMG 25693]|uniref:Thioredoxin n=1 Tax=Malaciobacter molluscorum LMG 25693 TaxID=870501 RepID=A0A2G1DFE2_9BACT|nr:thioredoxin family protein [Malaciobacter molluscorum]AXX91527.1 thioredoxin [Malaciobacter molluscorum LMG 25693]PHO17164.1 thiol reductase thioredoxin [Malaciobacter molluscorum LMG 25693]RXJ92776.1 thiol reductase thioredoxin [Malaciobacter molluscorum]